MLPRSKVAKTIVITYKSEYFLLKKSFFSLYYSFVYCNPVWPSTPKANLHLLIFLQKRIVRIIDNKDHPAHSGPSFQNKK